MTGTDTEVGKTWVSQGLMALLAQSGERVLGMKPVASGCVMTGQGLRSDDALMLQRQATESVAYEWVNPYAFAPPIAPKAAAAQALVQISPQRIMACFNKLSATADWLVVEGVGGWRVPLNGDYDVAAMARQFNLPVVLVVAIRLGCINHARLTAESIVASGCKLGGWVGNCIQDEQIEQDVVDELISQLQFPCLGIIPRTDNPQKVASYLRKELLIAAI